MKCPHGFLGHYCERCGGNTTRDGVVVFVKYSKCRCPHGVRDAYCEDCQMDVTRRGVQIPGYYPQAEEIASQCAQIQAGWSAKEFAKRRGVTINPYEVPEIFG